jgi:hypothetical protein
LQTIIAAVLIAIGTGFVSHRGVRHFRAWREPGEPPFWRRSTSAAWVILLRALPVVATACSCILMTLNNLSHAVKVASSSLLP